MRESIMRTPKVPFIAMKQNCSSPFPMSNFCVVARVYVGTPSRNPTSLQARPQSYFTYDQLRLSLVHLTVLIRHSRYNQIHI